jgi:hypothetical protein
MTERTSDVVGGAPPFAPPAQATAAAEKARLNLKVGEKGGSGQIIDFLYGRSDTVAVYRTVDGGIQYETRGAELTPVQSRVVQRQNRLYARAKTCLSGVKKKRIIDELGQALFLGLCDSDEARALGYFEDVDGELAQEAQLEARYGYVIWGSIGTVVALVAGTGVANITAGTASALGVGLAAGSVGAWASMLQRASKLKLEPFETPEHLAFQGITRILIGVVFGMVALAAMKANLLFGAFRGEWIIAVVTFAAGYSERIIPELISRIEAHEAEKKIADPGSES